MHIRALSLLPVFLFSLPCVGKPPYDRAASDRLLDLVGRDYSGADEQTLKTSRDFLRLFLRDGADPNAVDKNHDTPLMLAIMANNLSAMDCLLNHPATRVNQANYLYDKDGRLVCYTALSLAVVLERKEAVERLLQDKNIDMNKSFPFWIAARQGLGEIISLFLKYDKPDFDKYQQGSCNTDPLTVAALNGYLGIVEQLLKAGVHPCGRRWCGDINCPCNPVRSCKK